MQHVTQLGYLVFEVSDLARWEAFGRDVLGLQPSHNAEGSMALRMDDREHRILLVPGPADDLAAAGWELPNRAALDAFVHGLDAKGIKLMEGTAKEAASRKVEKLYRGADPSGNPLEFYCGGAIANQAFISPSVRSGFCTGDEGLGHIIVRSSNVDQSVAFYCDLLGLRHSDTIRIPMGPGKLDFVFLHANQRHHSIAFVGAPLPKRLHHFMIEANAMDEVGHAFDRCNDANVPVTRTLGRHPNDRMFSFYAQTPSGFEFEFGWDGRKVDDANWTTRTYGQISEWGHRPPAATLASSGASGEISVDGTWLLIISTPMGEQPATLNLTHKNGVIGGTLSNGGTDTVEIAAAALTGDTLSWKAAVTQPFAMTLEFAGVVTGNDISGKVKAGDFGFSPFTGSRR